MPCDCGPTGLGPWRIEGLIYEQSQQEEKALAKYLDAVQKGENSPEVARRALRLFYDKGEYAAANALLQELEDRQVPFTTDIFREQSRVLEGLQDMEGSLKAAEQAAKDSKDYRDKLWLGQLLSIKGQREDADKARQQAVRKDAETALQQAIRLNEKAPETWVALVEFFVHTDQKDRAEKALADARSKIPAAEAPLALAVCLEDLGKTDEAGQQYILALKQRPDDPNVVRNVAIYQTRQGDLPKAAEQLARIVSGQVQATPGQVVEARRLPGSGSRQSRGLPEPPGGDPPGRSESRGRTLVGRESAAEGQPAGQLSGACPVGRGAGNLRETGRTTRKTASPTIGSIWHNFTRD